MPDALTIFLYNWPFFNITNHSEAPRGYVICCWYLHSAFWYQVCCAELC